MKPPLRRVTFFTALVVLLGAPPLLFLDAGTGDTRTIDPQAEAPIRTLRDLVAQRSNLEAVYQGWQERYEAAGGDRNVTIGLGSPRGLGTEPSTPMRGRLEVDLIRGRLSARIQGLYGAEALDLWLVDNQPGPGRSMLPEKGDRMAHLGRVAAGDGLAELRVSLGPRFFDSFELDLVVASRAGETPVTSRVLMGTRPFFERLYTKTRIETRHAVARGGLLDPASLLSIFSPPAAEANSTQVLISHGLVGQQVGDGADLFFRGTFDGNGRTCGTCHPPEKNQEIGPDFIATLPSTDPLFVAEFSKNQGGVAGLERPALMRGFGLILENIDGAEDPTVKFTMRGVPHSLSLVTSILSPDGPGIEPVERTGWSGDGAPMGGALRFFPAGAVFQHFTKDLRRREGRDFTAPTEAELDAMEAFMLAVGRLNDLDLPNVSLTDAGADNGRLLFLDGNAGKCNNCHFNAGSNIAPGFNLNFNTGVEDRVHPARAVESFPNDGGLGLTPADCDGDNVDDCFGDRTFNTTPLVEAADTGPFFHNNVIDTLEGAVTFYTSAEFTNSPSGQFLGPIVLSKQQIDDIAAFLRVINAGFNLDISAQRNDAAISLENSSPLPGGCGGGGEETSFSSLCTSGGGTNGNRATVDALIALSNIEAADAVEVLTASGANPSAVSLIQSGIDKNVQALNTQGSNARRDLMIAAVQDFRDAKALLGTGLDFLMGEGNLLF